MLVCRLGKGKQVYGVIQTELERTVEKLAVKLRDEEGGTGVRWLSSLEEAWSWYEGRLVSPCG